MLPIPVLQALRRTSIVLPLLLAGITCRDTSSMGPGLPGRGALEVAPVLESTAPGGPVIVLEQVRALLIARQRKPQDTTRAQALFDGDSAVLRFDVTVVSPSELFELELEALDGQGTVTFRGSDTVRVVAGATASRDAPSMRYVAPDTAVRWLVLSPIDTTIDAGGSVPVAAVGLGADQQEIAALNVGWLSRDPLAATVSPGGLVTAMALERETWIIARTFTGVTDSVRVAVRGSVASLGISPDTTALLVGGTVELYAEARDASGTVLSAGGRDVTWSTPDPQIVSLGLVEQAVLSVNASPEAGATTIASTAVTGLAAGTARIVATSGSHADTALVVVSQMPDTTPPLALGNPTVSVGMRQMTDDVEQWVSLPAATASDVSVQLSTSDPMVAVVPATVVIPAGQTVATFPITGGDATGTVELRAVADGYEPALAQVDVGRPSFVLEAPTSMHTMDPPQPLTVWAVDHRGKTRTALEDVLVQLESSNPDAAKVDSVTVTIAKGARGSGVIASGASILPTGVGTTVLSAIDARTEQWAYGRGEATIEVRQPALSFGFSELTLGIGQYATIEVWADGAADTARIVTIGRSQSGVAFAPDAVQIPAKASSTVLQVTGMAAGSDTLFAAMPGYAGDSAAIRVDSGTVDVQTEAGASFTGLRVGETVMIRLIVQGPVDGTGGPVAQETTWALRAGAGLELSTDAGGTTLITSVTVSADQTVSAWFYVRATAAGASSLTATSASYRAFDRAVQIDP